ncbi:MAG: hypothetical protein ACRELF_03915 [Gemmataceae bacterium]
MAKSKEDSVFLDPSIQIARLVHGPQTKAGIRHRLAQHERVFTSLVVRQEFKRRLLKEAEYLLRLLHRFKSFDEVHQHVIRLFGPWPSTVRKRTICLQTLSQVHGGTDAERTDRLQLYLRSLLVTGLKQFDRKFGEVVKDAACACACVDVVEKQPLRRYDLGPEHCSRTKPGACGIVQFLTSRKRNWQAILTQLKSIPDAKKSTEIKNAERFLERLVESPNNASDDDPCLTVGDLVIALESVGIPIFYTLNSKESQHLCRALDQTLIVRPIDPTKAEVNCLKDEPNWPSFGAER